ncbi:MAG: hypothetical protein WA821_08960 [Anaerolineales bacterium]
MDKKTILRIADASWNVGENGLGVFQLKGAVTSQIVLRVASTPLRYGII